MKLALTIIQILFCCQAIALEKPVGKPASPELELTFPRDHGAHFEAAYEWWYVTGHLYDLANQKKVGGMQVTLFRTLPAFIGGPHRLMVHLAWSDFTKKTYIHKEFFLPLLKSARLSEETLHVDLPHFQMQFDDQGRLKILTEFFHDDKKLRFSVDAKNTKNTIVLHGNNGYSLKGDCATCASMYSSVTRFDGSMAIHENHREQTFQLRAWYDHEFGSNTLSKNTAGWDWFSLQLQSNSELMVFQLRDKTGGVIKTSGTLVEDDGTTHHLTAAHLALSPGTERHGPYPISWNLQLSYPGFQRAFEIRTSMPNQEFRSSWPFIPSYWEGSMEVFDDNQKYVGDAYLEMTGYNSDSQSPRF